MIILITNNCRQTKRREHLISPTANQKSKLARLAGCIQFEKCRNRLNPYLYPFAKCLAFGVKYQHRISAGGKTYNLRFSIDKPCNLMQKAVNLAGREFRDCFPMMCYRECWQHSLSTVFDQFSRHVGHIKAVCDPPQVDRLTSTQPFHCIL